MQKLIEGLHRFQSEVFTAQRDLFSRLSQGQSPEVMFITCSDSRVSPTLITQSGPGDMFVMRNAGNIVPPYGTGADGEDATIEFALVGLKIRHIVICGHSDCGAMKGLLHPEMLETLPAMKTWLKHGEPTRRIMDANYQHLHGKALVTATAEENVLTQLENLRTHPAVQERLARRELTLHGWVYKLETGQMFNYDHEVGQFTPLVRPALPPLLQDERAAG
jgi:carbonic anhydrase